MTPHSADALAPNHCLSRYAHRVTTSWLSTRPLTVADCRHCGRCPVYRGNKLRHMSIVCQIVPGCTAPAQVQTGPGGPTCKTDSVRNRAASGSALLPIHAMRIECRQVPAVVQAAWAMWRTYTNSFDWQLLTDVGQPGVAGPDAAHPGGVVPDAAQQVDDQRLHRQGC